MSIVTVIELEVEPVSIVGIYSHPGCKVQYSDGEVRQQFSVCFLCQIMGGEVSPGDESLELGFFEPDQINQLEMSQSARLRLGHYLEHRHEPVID